MFKDINDKPIAPGDTIIFTVGQGQAVASLGFGTVISYTAKTILVQELEPDLTPVLKREGYWQGSGEYYERSYHERVNNYPPREKQEFVQTGNSIANPTRINNPRPDRLYIMP